MRLISKFLSSLALGGMLIGVGAGTAAQENAQPAALPSSCSRDNALEIVEQQIGATRTFDNTRQRITVMVRAGDLLWSYRQKQARATFTEAFDLALRKFKEKGEELTREGKILIRGIDQRYAVLSAIAKHDPAWAKKLTEQLLKEEQQEAEEKASEGRDDVGTAEKLLTMARSLLGSDEATAINFARRSLRYPATSYLSVFLYALAELNRAAADQFYQEALATYANAPMERFLYLSSYPFGNDREAGRVPDDSTYQVPAGFGPNSNLQRSFVENVLRRVRELSNTPWEPGAGERLSEPEQMWLALTRLEGQIQQSLPDLAARVEAARGNLYTQLSQSAQRQIDQIANPDKPPQRTFDEQVEAALKNPNVDLRDHQLASAVISASKEEGSLDRVLSAVDKISDSEIRQPLLDWLFFERARLAIKERKLDEARKLALRVDELDQRAWLYLRIAEESLKQNIDQTQAREVLDEVADASAKAPNTPVAARALLGVAYLYTKIDMNRAIAVMTEAVRRINRIEDPEFSRQFVIRKIEGRTFGTYAAFLTPGFTPESAFREIGKIDFDGMLNLASNFSDKYLRASTTLTLAEVCLQQTQKAEKPSEKTKPKPAKP